MFIKVVLTEYSAFNNSSKIIQEQAAAIIIALISEKNKSRKKRKKRRVCVKPWLKRRKNFEFYATLLTELRLEDEYNYDILLRMTSKHFEEIFQLIKDDITKGNTKLRELIPLRLTCSHTWFFVNTGIIQELLSMIMSNILPTQI